MTSSATNYSSLRVDCRIRGLPRRQELVEFQLRQKRYDDGVESGKDFVLALDTIRKHGHRSCNRSIGMLNQRSTGAGPPAFPFKTRDNMKPLMTVATTHPVALLS